MMEETTAPLPMLPTTPTVPTMPTVPMTGQRQRTWPALLTLLFLSPVVGEMISGSTPPLLFIQPFSFIFLPTLYGICALFIRELVVRRQLGWGNVLLMGAAFGAFQEALVVQTWFNFMAPSSPSHSSGTYGVLWQTNWDWALNLTIYHAVVSIAVPLILIDLFYPRSAGLPWLKKKGVIALSIWLLVLCTLLAYYIGFRNFVNAGYTHPPLYSYLSAVAITAVLFLAGIFLRFPVARPTYTQPAPRLWTVRLTCFSLMATLYIVVATILPATHLPALIGMFASVALLAYGLWRVRSWSARPGWSARHRLAVATGILMYFIFLFGPLIEFGLHMPSRTGLTITNLVIFAGLILFDQHLKRRTHQTEQRAADVVAH